LVPGLGRFVKFLSTFQRVIYPLFRQFQISLSRNSIPYAKMTSMRSLGISTTAQGLNAWCITAFYNVIVEKEDQIATQSWLRLIHSHLTKYRGYGRRVRMPVLSRAAGSIYSSICRPIHRFYRFPVDDSISDFFVVKENPILHIISVLLNCDLKVLTHVIIIKQPTCSICMAIWRAKKDLHGSSIDVRRSVEEDERCSICSQLPT
jgi:hypothetical protein